MKKSRNGGFVAVAAITLILAVLAVLCLSGSSCQAKEAADRAKRIHDEAAAAIARENASIEAENAADEAQYRQDLADYRARLAETEGQNDAWPTPAGEGWEVVDLTGYELELPQTVTISRQDMLYNGLLLVNRWHARPDDFDDAKPAYVHRVNKEISLSDHNQRLLDSAISGWTAILADAVTQHQWDYFMLDNCYRTAEAQKALYDEQAARLNSNYSDPEELLAAAQQRAGAAQKDTAYPGTSEYNTGLSAWPRLYKANDSTITAKNSDFFSSEEGLWLLEHCWEYGLVFRYPLADYPVKGTADKSYITGVSARRRLFRYVGPANAAAMHALGDLCLEEYIEYLGLHPHIAVYEDGKLKYEIYREAVQNAVSVRVTHTGKVDESQQESMLDNLTYFDDDGIEWAFVVTVITY